MVRENLKNSGAGNSRKCRKPRGNSKQIYQHTARKKYPMDLPKNDLCVVQTGMKKSEGEQRHWNEEVRRGTGFEKAEDHLIRFGEEVENGGACFMILGEGNTELSKAKCVGLHFLETRCWMSVEKAMQIERL